MITLEEIKKIKGAKPILKDKFYSQVMQSPLENTFSLKSKSGKEYIYHDGKVFYHSDGIKKEIKRKANKIIETVVTRMVEGKEINTIHHEVDKKAGISEIEIETQDFFVRFMEQDLELLNKLLEE